MGERVEPTGLTPDVIEPPIARQLVAVLAVDLRPRLVRRRLRLEDQAVEIEDERPDVRGQRRRSLESSRRSSM
jgi:hypothetical protein